MLVPSGMATKLNPSAAQSQAPMPDGLAPASAPPLATRHILAVSRQGRFDTGVMEHTIRIAERLGLDLICLYVDPLANWADQNANGRRFADTARANAAYFKASARDRGVSVKAVITDGKVVDTVQRIVGQARRIEFVVVEPGMRTEELIAALSVPVFTAVVKPNADDTGQSVAFPRIISPLPAVQAPGQGIAPLNPHFGGNHMAETPSRKTAIQKTVMFGAAAAALYAAVFAFADPIMAIATKGGVFAVVPVAAVFVFSYVHGNFTNYFWSALGIEASKTVVVKPTARVEKPAKRKDTRPRARLNV